MNIEKSARHEAAHALYAWGQGEAFPIAELMVGQRGTEGGCTYVTFPLATWQLTSALRPDGDPRNLSYVQGIVGVLMAGCLAEPALLAGDDYDQVSAWRAEWASLRTAPMSWSDLQASVRADVLAWVETYGAEVSALARLLTGNGRMSGNRFRREAQALGLHPGYWSARKNDIRPLPLLPAVDWRAPLLSGRVVTYA